MPNCFQLVRKTDGEAERLNVIDDKIREHFAVDPDPVKYYCSWYDIVGFKLALGKTFEEIIAELKESPYAGDSDLIAVAEYINEHYTARAWYQRHKD